MPQVNTSINLNFGNIPQTLGEVRAEFRQLSQVVQGLTRDSEQYNAVVRRLGELRGEMRGFRDDLNQLNPEQQFRAFQGVLNGLVGGFAAATGAVALFGAQNEELEKTLTKVNGAVALLGGFQSMQDGIKDLKLLLGLTNAELAIFLVALTAIGGAAYYVSQSVNTLTSEQKAFYEVQKKSIDGYVKEKVAIESLLAEAQRDNTTRQRKKEIIQELNQTSPLYFHNIKTEADLQDKATTAVARYVKAIEIKAQVQAAQDKLAKAEEKIIGRQIELQEDLARYQDPKRIFDTEERRKKGIEILTKTIAEGTDSQLVDLQKEAEPVLNVIANLQKQLDMVGGDPKGTRNDNYVKAVKDWQAYLDELEKRAEATEEKIKFQQVQMVDPNALASAAKQRADALAKATGTETIDPTKIKNPITGLTEKETKDKLDRDFQGQENTLLDQRAQGLLGEQAFQDQMLQIRLNSLEAQKQLAIQNGESTLEYDAAISNTKIEIAKNEQEQKLAFAEATATGLSAISDIVGKDTIAGKALAVASALISTYLAISKTLAAFAGVPIPGYAIAQAIATGLVGLAQVKQILAVKVPTKGGDTSGGGVSASLPSYTAPSVAAASTTTNLSGNSLAQINNRTNAPIRAYVVESDVTDSQGRVRSYQAQGTI